MRVSFPVMGVSGLSPLLHEERKQIKTAQIKNRVSGSLCIVILFVRTLHSEE